MKTFRRISLIAVLCQSFVTPALAGDVETPGRDPGEIHTPGRMAPSVKDQITISIILALQNIRNL